MVAAVAASLSDQLLNRLSGVPVTGRRSHEKTHAIQVQTRCKPAQLRLSNASLWSHSVAFKIQGARSCHVWVHAPEVDNVNRQTS
jgi:hypothetical protein